MAVHIGITKIQEDDTSVVYAFTRSEPPSPQGRLRIDKATGQVTLIEQLPGDTDGRAYSRAAHKIKTAWRVGTYPDKTCWAS